MANSFDPESYDDEHFGSPLEEPEPDQPEPILPQGEQDSPISDTPSDYLSEQNQNIIDQPSGNGFIDSSKNKIQDKAQAEVQKLKDKATSKYREELDKKVQAIRQKTVERVKEASKKQLEKAGEKAAARAAVRVGARVAAIAAEAASGVGVVIAALSTAGLVKDLWDQYKQAPWWIQILPFVPILGISISFAVVLGVLFSGGSQLQSPRGVGGINREDIPTTSTTISATITPPDPEVCKKAAAHPNIRFLDKQGVGKQIFANGGTIPTGTKTGTGSFLKTDRVDAALCSYLVAIADANPLGKPISVTASVTGIHSGASSRHYFGKALDIDFENSSREEPLKLLRWTRDNQGIFASQGMRINELFGAQPDNRQALDLQLRGGEPYTTFVGGHDNHMHISFF